MKNLLIALSILAIIVGCGKKKSPCEVVTCKDRQVCDNGTCKCDSESFDLGNWCFPKKLGNNLVFYSQSDCACFDTIVLMVNPEPRAGGGANPEPLAMSVTAIFPGNEKTTGKSVAADYYPKPDGDSLFMTYQYFWFGCPNERLNPVAMCKFNKAKDTLRMKMLWYRNDAAQIPVLIDSCNKIFTRKI